MPTKDREVRSGGAEDQIRTVLTELTAALRDKNADDVIALLADDAVTFDLAPPLRMGPQETHDPAPLEQWFATWESPIVSEPGDLTIAVDGDVAREGVQCKRRAPSEDARAVREVGVEAMGIESVSA